MDEVSRLYSERGFRGTQAAGDRPALLIVDMMLGFTDPESPLYCAADEAVANIQRLLVAARSARIAVAYTRVLYDAAARRVAAAFIDKVPSLLTLEPGSRWIDIDGRISPQPDEPVLTKHFASAFFGTALDAYLVGARCDTVIVTGASTSGCVRASAVDALQHGYRVVVPRDAVADRARAPHEASLFDIEAKYGSVVETSAVITMLAGASKAAATPE